MKKCILLLLLLLVVVLVVIISLPEVSNDYHWDQVISNVLKFLAQTSLLPFDNINDFNKLQSASCQLLESNFSNCFEFISCISLFINTVVGHYFRISLELGFDICLFIKILFKSHFLFSWDSCINSNVLFVYCNKFDLLTGTE